MRLDHVYMVPPYADLTISNGVLRLGARETREHLGDAADALRFLMLDDDDGEAGMVGQLLQQGRDGLDAAGGSADADDRKERLRVLLQRVLRNAGGGE